MKQDIRISDDVRDVLAKAVVEGNILRLTGQLDRDLYTRTNKALEALGGTWNRKQRGHVFAGDPRAAIDGAAESGKVAHPNQLDFFATPRALAEMACERLAMGDGWKRTLEPSAGEGDLVMPLIDWHGMPPVEMLALVEMDPRRRAMIGKAGIDPFLSDVDFLGMRPERQRLFDRILMNPPFHRGLDAKHIAHALDFLAPGGRLVAIASGALPSRTDKATTALRERIEAWGGTIEALPEGSFKAAGTNVATVMVTVDRPKENGK